MQRFITIMDIARELNISVATVSRAMRDAYDVSKKTRERVLEKAVQMNYKPNFNAIGLAKSKTHTIGVIVPSITNYYFSTVFTGIQEIAYRENYQIVLYVTNDSAEKELEIVSNLSITSFDGLLVSTCSSSATCSHFQEVMDNGVPIVFFDRVPAGIETSKVVQDDFNGAFEAVEHLLACGYSRIAHITGPEDLDFTTKRLQGYLAALAKHDIPLNPDWIIYSGFSQECGEHDVQQLLGAKERPDAIFAVNDRKAIGAMLALKKKNIKIGEEMGVIGFTDDPACSLISPALTTIAEPAFAIGTTSCELMFKHIRKKYFEPQQVVLSGRLVKRESCMR